MPVATVRLWRRGALPQRAHWVVAGQSLCDVCGLPGHAYDALPLTAYVYLLAVYLGDGCIVATKNSWNLRIVLDGAYQGIIEECQAAIATVRGHKPKALPSRRDRSVVISSSWVSWACLLPQHGPGRKHERKIELMPWQRELVGRAPGVFLRGLIHTDGWRGVNRVIAKGKRYEYPRYQFSNRSDDIRRLFTDACDALGVQWRRWTRYHISVAKTESVALLDAFVGPKT